MDYKNVSTNYVALAPPYKIIKYGNMIGAQIGTQVVTISGGNPFRIETHNYPVVAAENRITPFSDGRIHIDSSSEGEVWDNVETRQVSVLCEMGVQLHWTQFIKILWHDHARLGRLSEKIQKVHIFNKVLMYNGSQELPSSGEYVIHLHTKPSDGIPEVVCSETDDVFALNVEWSDDPVELEQRIVNDLLEYLIIISPNRIARYWRMTYETTEERLIPLVERLNSNEKATSFKKTLMCTFTVKALPPYKEKGCEDNSASIPRKSEFSHLIAKPECAEKVINRLHELISSKKNPKARTKPIRAAMDAGAISRPSWTVFCEEFGIDPKSTWKSAFNNYTNPAADTGTQHPYHKDSTFPTMKSEFEKLIQ